MSNEKKKYLSKLEEENIDEKIINSIKKYDPKIFFDKIFEKDFFSEKRIPIGCGEKNDQPAALARMINYVAMNGDSHILEIGTGTGYSTAILSALSKKIVTVEYHKELALSAKERLTNLKINNVKFFAGNIFEYDHPELFDSIVIFAAYYERPLYLTRFLKEDGTIIFPMGPPHQQQIAVLKRSTIEANENKFEISFHEYCEFTPLKEMYE